MSGSQDVLAFFETPFGMSTPAASGKIGMVTVTVSAWQTRPVPPAQHWIHVVIGTIYNNDDIQYWHRNRRIQTNVVICRATQCSADFYWQRKTNFMHSWDLIWTYRLFLEEKLSKSTAAVKCLFYWPLRSHTAQIKPRGIFHWNSFHSQPTSVPTRSVAISSGRRTQWGPNPAKRGLNLCYTTRVIITHTAAVQPSCHLLEGIQWLESAAGTWTTHLYLYARLFFILFLPSDTKIADFRIDWRFMFCWRMSTFLRCFARGWMDICVDMSAALTQVWTAEEWSSGLRRSL